MPPVSNTGAPSATGTLVFGIGTQSNNALAASQTFTTDAYGDLNNSVFNGTTVQAFLDSGSNAYFFADSSLAQCGSNFAGFYCPSSAQTRSITLVGLNSTQSERQHRHPERGDAVRQQQQLRVQRPGRTDRRQQQLRSRLAVLLWPPRVLRHRSDRERRSNALRGF